MSEKNYLSKILDYLRGRLSPEEGKAFEEAMQNDPKLREEVETTQGTKQVLDHLAYQELNEFLKQENELLKQRKATKIRWFIIVLTILTLLFLGLFLLKETQGM